METISLARGVPSPECVPVEELAECALAAVRADGATILSYGPAGGYAPLRRWIAEQYGVSQARVVLTNGSLQGFALIAQVMAGGGERVLVEAPTYDRPLRILGSLGAEVAPVRCDGDGLDVDALEAELRRGRRPAFLYVIPTFQNPTGRTLSAERRCRLVELAAAHDLLLLEDDPYGSIRFEGDAPATLFELDGGKHVAFSGSFSKTVAPGIRVGYLVLPERLARAVESAAASTYITPALLPQATVHEFLRRGHLERSARQLAPRREAGCAACSPRGASGRDRRAVEPARGRLFPLARPPGRRERPGGPPRRAGSRRVVHRRAGLLSVGGRRGELGQAGLQLRLAGAATGGCPATGGACHRVACDRAATAARRLERRTRPSAPSPRSARPSR